MFLIWFEVPYRKGYIFQLKSFGIKQTRGFWGEGIILMPPLNNFSDFFLEKNDTFCDFKKDYTFRFSKQFEKKVNANLENFSFSNNFPTLIYANLFFTLQCLFVFLTSNACQWMSAKVSAAKKHFVIFNIWYLITKNLRILAGSY